MIFQNRWELMTIWSHLAFEQPFRPIHHILSTIS